MEEFKAHIERTVTNVRYQYGKELADRVQSLYEAALDEDQLTRSLFYHIDTSEGVVANLGVMHTSLDSARSVSEHLVKIFTAYRENGMFDMRQSEDGVLVWMEALYKVLSMMYLQAFKSTKFDILEAILNNTLTEGWRPCTTDPLQRYSFLGGAVFALSWDKISIEKSSMTPRIINAPDVSKAIYEEVFASGLQRLMAALVFTMQIEAYFKVGRDYMGGGEHLEEFALGIVETIRAIHSTGQGTLSSAAALNAFEVRKNLLTFFTGSPASNNLFMIKN